MPTYDVEGVPVDFPHPAYSCQIEYMKSVICALSHRQNALLESPTGTGKTLSMLCAVLGWLKHNQATGSERRSRVYYTSRTHSQLKQVIREFRRTAFGQVFSAGVVNKKGGLGEVNIMTDLDQDETVSMTILASRDKLCVHPRAERCASAAAHTATCNSLRSNRKCRFFNNLNPYLSNFKAKFHSEERSATHLKKNAIGDIEDLLEVGRKNEFCPFYLTRKLAEGVDIVFCPYNYLVDPSVRSQIGLDLQDSIIIIDEAHNLASQTTQACSFSVTDVSLGEAVTELSQAGAAAHTLPKYNEAEASSLEARFNRVAQFLTRLVYIINESVGKRAEGGGVPGDAPKALKGDADDASILPGDAVLSLLRQAKQEGNAAEKNFLANTLKVVEEALGIATENMTENGEPMGGSSMGGLERVQKFLSGVQSSTTHSAAENGGKVLQSYRTVVFREQTGDKRYAKHGVPQPIQLGVWCIDAGVAMRRLITPATAAETPPRSVLVTSGTLSPLEFFAQEMGIPFPIRMQNSHVIQQSQIMGAVIRAGMNGVPLSSKFQNRKNVGYVNGLGQTIAKLAAIIPDGLIVFFQSFAFMKDMVDAWKKPGSFNENRTIYDTINTRKIIIQEANSQAQNTLKVDEYKQAVESSGGDGRNGAVLFAVFRGKLSEGMDMPDRLCRGVALVGIPYANRSDLSVKLKMEADSKWYSTDALRSVNQAIGRVIRHSRDHGSVFLLDERYALDHTFKTQLPQWVLQTSSTYQTLDATTQSKIEGFYKQNHNPNHAPIPECNNSLPAKRLKLDFGRTGVISGEPEKEKTMTKQTEIALRSAKRYTEARKEEEPARLRGVVQSDLFEAGVVEVVEEKETRGTRRRIGAVPVKEFAPAAFKAAVKAALNQEEYAVWKALLREFAASLDNATVFMSTRFLPWLVNTFTDKHHELLRSHAFTLPESLRAEYATLLRAQMRMYQSMKRKR